MILQYANEVEQSALYHYIGETQRELRTKPGKKGWPSTSGLMGEWLEC